MLKFTLILLLTVTVMSCVYRKIERPALEPCGGVAKDSARFNEHVLPILLANCTNPGCHSGTRPQGNLNLEKDKAYLQLTSPFKGYMDTLEPINSVLYNTLTSPVNLMPPTGKLPDCEIEIIMKWMAQKAKNN